MNSGIPRRLQRQMQRLDCAGLERGESDAGQHVLLRQQLTGRKRLILTLGGEIDIPPAGEAVFQVPLALAVTHEDETRQVIRLPVWTGP